MKTLNLFFLTFSLSIASFAQHPSIGGLNVYYGSLHNHSNYSDGSGTPDQAYSYAKNTGKLDFFGLSDHAYLISATEWTNTKTAADVWNQDGVFTTFRGFEWTHSTLGHVTVVNTDDYCTINSATNFDALLNWINSRECVAFFNHPGRQNTTYQEFNHFQNSPSEKLVGIELWNKTDAFNTYYYNDGYFSPDGGMSYFDEANQLGWKIGAGGAEDNHSATWGTATNYRLAVLANQLSRTAIYEALKNRRFFTTLDKNLALSFKINGNEMGSAIQGSAGQSVQILASDADGELFSMVKLYKNGVAVNTWTPLVSNVQINHTMNTADGDYFYIKVTQADGDEAISSPIFIHGITDNQPPVCILTSPAGGDNFNPLESIVLSASATDPDGNIAQVEFFVDGYSVGTDYSMPYQINWLIPAEGTFAIQAKASDELGLSTNSAPVTISAGNVAQTITGIINSSADDAEEAEDGYMYLTSSDLELVYDSYVSHTPAIQGNQTVGLRFSGLNLPPNAHILNAYIQFTCDESVNNPGTLYISGHASDNSPSFTSSAYNISNRIKTSSDISWTPPNWVTVNEKGINQQTPDLSIIIQEIINRPGYSLSSAISLIITGTGTRTAHSYDGSPLNAPELIIQYNTAEQNSNPVFSVNPIIKSNASEDAVYSASISGEATDPDGDILTFSKVSGPTWLNVAANGSLSGTPAQSDVGLNSWVVTASDGNGGSASATLQISVNNSNDNPVFSVNPIIKSNASEDAVYSASISGEATDPDGDILTFSKVSGPTWLNVAANGSLSGTPAQSDVGLNSWVVAASDGNGGSASATLQITVITKPTISYCESTGSTSSSFIQKIQVNDFVNNSGNNGGYKYFNNLPVIELAAGSTASIILTPEFYGRSTHQYWSVWLDYNKNGIFDQAEQVFSPLKSKSAVSGNIVFPNSTGITRMRISMSDSGTPAACGNIGNGEVEDYLVNISSSTAMTPVADFSANKTNVLVNESITFSDLSLNSPATWNWDFGNGLTSTLQNPILSYSAKGVYSVSLIVSNSAGSDTEIKAGYITVNELPANPPVADFSANATNVEVNAQVSFTDLSTNLPTNWSWNFGDGKTSTLQNPTTSYSTPGIYTVSLTATNGTGSDTETKTGYMTVIPLPVSLYCTPNSIINSADYINSIGFGSITSITGEGSSGYRFYTSPEIGITVGQQYAITLSPFSNSNRNFWRIWLDSNGDGDFDDAGETLFAANNKKGTVTGSILIPTDCSATNTRLRISMKNNSSPSACDDGFSGEVEDYMAIINLTPVKSGSILTNSKINIENKMAEMLIYPVPAHERLFIEFKNWKTAKNVSLIDITGKKIWLQKTSAEIMEVNVFHFPKGIYLLRAENGKMMFQKKIIIK